MVTTYDIQGRMGIGVAQQSGTDYPFVAPSDDVRYLLADACLTYDDPADYDRTLEPWVLPFRIAWLYGVGTVPNSHPVDFPTPTHSAECVILDANDDVVFDSTLATLQTKNWGDRLKIYEWTGADGILRITAHTAWSPDDTPEPQEYDVNITPENGVLDARVVERLPRRVKSLTCVLDNMAQTAVDFVEGFNINIVKTDPVSSPGKRRVTALTFAAEPGNGQGIFPGCEPQPLYIRTINGISPNAGGDFHLSATDCYFVRQPTQIVSESPRLSLPNTQLAPGNVSEVDLPDALAGISIDASGWPATVRYAHLLIGNNCGPCCDCPDYVLVADYMNETRDRYHKVGRSLEQTRNLHHENLARWSEARACFHRRPLRVALRAQACPFLDVAIQLCNQSDQCLREVQLSVTLTSSATPGTIVDGYTFITGAAQKPGRRSSETERYVMGGAWPTFTAFWDAVNPFATVDAKFRLKFADCDAAANVSATVTGSAGGQPMLVTPVGSSDTATPSEPATASAETTLNCPAGPDQLEQPNPCIC